MQYKMVFAIQNCVYDFKITHISNCMQIQLYEKIVISGSFACDQIFKADRNYDAQFFAQIFTFRARHDRRDQIYKYAVPTSSVSLLVEKFAIRGDGCRR